MERSLAKIKSARLFYHNGPPMLTSYLDLVYADPGRPIGGSGQGFGGYGLGEAYAFKWINGVMECLGVEDWTDVPGKYVWVDHEHIKAHRIISVDTGRTFDPTLWKEEIETTEANEQTTS